ncbi:hypothetical protein [Actinophytocola xinjiangensis]|uniref:hypothetical protein n=1 Tax=Actinophytocola xinjiangensis TaxID=485602 RepID=UPI001B808931|nr:hypothetical protein [Actinophytocola xinjiangensis]
MSVSAGSCWVEAEIPDHLVDPANGPLLPSVRTAIAYNLTVDDIHTYYVLAGSAPILVHNSGCSPFTDGGIWDGSFDVGGQNIETMATVRMVGDTVHLDGLIVFAKGAQGLNQEPVGSDAIRQIKRPIPEQARNQGFKTVVLIMSTIFRR